MHIFSVTALPAPSGSVCPEATAANPNNKKNNLILLPFVPVHHRQTCRRRTKVGNALPFERSDIGGPQIRAAKCNTRHPGRDSAAGCEQHIFGNVVRGKLPL